MADSVKKQVLAQVLDLCKSLISDNTVRKVERKHALFLTEAITPALHVVVGDEKVLYQDERGYNMQFPVAFHFIFATPRDPESSADEFEARIQKLIEADEQLGGLVSKITYNGSAPFVIEDMQPVNVAIVMYLFEYRRFKGDPAQNY